MTGTRETTESPDGRAIVLGCAIDRLDMESTLARCERFIQTGEFAQHIAINAAKLVAMRTDPELREVARRCELVSADGQAIVWASRLLGDALPCRVAGIDLMHRLLERSAAKGYRVYILGARPEVLARAVERLHERYPSLVLAGCRDGYFAPSEDEQVAAEIRAARPDILLVAMSSPRKEYFLGTRGRELGIPFVMGVGGAIDIAAGVTRRAPVPMQRLGLEWLFRLLQEPRRMLRRYAVSNYRFVVLLARELTAARLARSRG